MNLRAVLHSLLRSGAILFSALLLLIGAYYFYCLPFSVQSGDTGELVAAAYNRFLAHPPGYPLWIWLMHFLLHAVSMGTVFWRASLFSALFAMGALTFLGYPLRRSPIPLALCVLFLALSRAFRESAVLPDVFSFHALIVAAFASMYLFASGKCWERTRAFALPFLFCIGVAHHLTIICLLPALLSTLSGVRKSRSAIWAFAFGGTIGAICTIVFYTSLRWLNTESYFSWGLPSTASLIPFVLRFDYGVFQLTTSPNSLSLWPLFHFARTSLLEISPVLLLTIWVLARNKSLALDTRFLAWVFSCALSLLFFLLANIQPVGVGEEVLLRFHVMPVVLLIYLCGFVLIHWSPGKREALLCALFVPFLVLLGVRAADMRELSSDTVVEDYSVNFLNVADPSLIVAPSDTVYFGLRYAQAMLGVGSHSAVIAPSLFFHPWYTGKIRERLPGLRIGHEEEIHRTRDFDFGRDLMETNIGSTPLVFNGTVPWEKLVKITYHLLGRKAERGSGVAFSNTPSLIIRSVFTGSRGQPQYFTKKLLFSHYAFFYLARGRQQYKEGFVSEALADWRTALEKVPYAFPALKNLCEASHEKAPACAKENFEEIRNEAQGFF